MGEAKQEEAKVETKPEEKKDEKPAEEKKEAAEPGHPPPIVLFVELHCVEEVEMDMAQNIVTVKGLTMDPQTLCSRIQKRTMRSANVLSPLPPAEGEATNHEAPPPQIWFGLTSSSYQSYF